MSQEETDKLFNTITSNGCREMDEVRFHQAVNEALQNSKHQLIEKYEGLVEELDKLIQSKSYTASIISMWERDKIKYRQFIKDLKNS